MKLEQQVCSLELAKKLKELGVKQESYAYYVKTELTPSKAQVFDATMMSDYTTARTKIVASAFTVAELGEMLPVFLETGGKKDRKKFKLYLAKNESSEWFIEYHEWSLEQVDNYELLVQRMADTEADARAKMLIYLLENNLLQKEAADITTSPLTSPNGRITEEHLDKCVMCGNPATHIQEHFGEPLCDNPTCEREALEADCYILERKHS